MCEAYTRSFFGTQPRITQVPPMRYSSAIITRAPWPAAIRAARTPPEPPPITNRSTSNSAISVPDRSLFLTRFLHANRHPLRLKTRSDFLAALAHLGAEFAVDRFGETRCPLIHIGHAELDCPRLRRQQF